MTGLPRGYDGWRTAGPDEDRVEVGVEDGQQCNRTAEPDEDNPRPRPCTGTMFCDEVVIVCDLCGETAE